MSVFTYSNCEIDIDIDGKDLPPTVSLFTAVIREFYEYAVPTLNLGLVDSTNSLESADIILKDQTKINMCIYMPGKPMKKLPFRITSIKPQVVRSQSIYYISAIFDSYLVTTNTTPWNFTGTISDAWNDIISKDTNPVELFIDNTSTTVNSYTKLKNETFAKYIRRVLIPSTTNSDNTSYFCYYHDGYNCYIKDSNLLMGSTEESIEENPSNFKLTNDIIIRWQYWSDSFSNNLQNSSYNGNFWQFNVNTGQYETATKASSNVLYNVNAGLNIVPDDRIVVAGSNMGNHPQTYLQSIQNNLRNSGLYNIKVLVQLNFDTFTTGLTKINFEYSDNKVIPFIIVGKSTIFRNGGYEQHLLLETNNINASPLNLFSAGNVA